MPLPIYLMSNFPSVRPSLNLQFDSQPTPEDMTSHLASVGATFSRASIGTYTDANGLVAEASAGQARPNYSSAGVHEGLLIEESRVNLLKSSEDFSIEWTPATRVKSVINQIIAPDGKASADLVNSNSLSAGVRFIYISENISTGTDYTVSVYAKSQNLTHARLVINSQDSTGEWVSLQCDLSDGSFTTLQNGSEVTLVRGNVTDVGNGWYRLEVTASTTDGAIYVMASLSDGTAITSSDSRGALNYTPSSIDDGVYLWGAQLEEGSFPTSYIPTIPTFSSRASTATFFNSSGVLSTASTNVARTDHKYIGGQWVEAGLLLEGASTNIALQSEDFSTTWTAIRATVSTNQITAPDGTTTADKLEEGNSGVTDRYVRQLFSQTSGTDYTFSCFVKKDERTQCRLGISGYSPAAEAYFNLDSGTVISSQNLNSAKIENVGNDWYRCSISLTGNATASVYAIIHPAKNGTISYEDVLGYGIYIWGAQLEEQSQPTSYIPTSGATADRALDDYDTNTKERSADVWYIDGTAFTDFYNQEQGTFFVFWEGFTDGGVDRWLGVHDSSKPNVFDDRIIFAFSTSAESIRLTISDDGVIQTSSVNDTNVPQTTPSKYALAVKLNDVNSYQDGVQVVSDSSVTMPSADKLIFHNGSGVRPFQGYIRKLIYFPRRLTNNELIKLTQ